MKKLIVFIVILFSVKGYTQVYQQPTLFGKEENRFQVHQLLAVPADTITPVTVKNNKPHIAVKDGVLYAWNVALQKWLPATGDTTNNNYPTSLGFASDVLTLGRNGLSNLTATIPLSTKLNTSDTAAMLANYAKNSQIANLTTIVNNIQTTQDNTVFTNGLLKTGNQVVALYQQSIWNAGQLQGYNIAATAPTDGQVLKWVAANNRYEPGTGGGSVDLSNYYTKTQSDARYLQSYTESDAIALAALADTAAAIRADMAGLGGGGSQDLQQTLNNGYTLTKYNQIVSPDNLGFRFVAGDSTYSNNTTDFYLDGTMGSLYSQDASQSTEIRAQASFARMQYMNTKWVRVDANGIQLRDGTEGVGKVWTSDASGYGHWADPAAGGGDNLNSVLARGGVLGANYDIDFGAAGSYAFNGRYYTSENTVNGYYRFTGTTDDSKLIIGMGLVLLMQDGITSSYTVKNSDTYIRLSGGSGTLTMPSPVGGQLMWLYNISGSAWSLAGASIKQPDGTPISTLANNTFIQLIGAYPNWVKIN